MPVVRGRGESATDRSSEAGLNEHDVFEILANRRRRYSLHYLLRNGDRCEVGELAEQIAAWENGVTVAEVTAAQRKRAYTALQQNHLPQMDETGIIEYDQPRGTIETTEVIEDFDIYLEVVKERDIPWSEYYLGLSAMSLTLTVGAWANVLPLPLSDAAYGLFVAVALAVSATAHHYYHEKLGASGDPPEIERD